MDWRSVDFDWNRARAFLVTAEEGSYSAAARALRVAQPTVGRQVAALEEELGVGLFERVGNRMELTAAGVELVEHVRAMGAAASRVSLAATGQATALDGEVAITASELVSAHVLPAAIASVRAAHPGIGVELVVTNEVRDLRRREADIAVRHAPPRDVELVARKVATWEAGLFGSSDYLDRLGRPVTPEVVGRASIFAFDRTDVLANGLRAMGVPVAPDAFRIVCPSHLVQWSMCRAGLGLCMAMVPLGASDPAVERVLPEVRMPFPVWLTTHRELRTSRRIRVVFDALAEVLAAYGT